MLGFIEELGLVTLRGIDDLLQNRLERLLIEILREKQKKQVLE